MTLKKSRRNESIVSRIHVAAQDAKDSLDRTLESTGQMSEKIETVTDTVDRNVEM